MSTLFYHYQRRINEYLGKLDLVEDAKYLLLNPGHRLRPILTCLWAHHFDVPVDAVIPYAAAVEILHTASLLHDDLPCMDDETCRRGAPPLHRVAGEARAVVAGDYLITQAYRMILDNYTNDSHSAIYAMKLLQSGAECLMVGQIGELVHRDIEYVNENKTASLFGIACALGCVFNDIKIHQVKIAHEFGKCFGLAYQYLDDIKDKDGSTCVLSIEDIERRISDNIGICKHIAEHDSELLQILDLIFTTEGGAAHGI